MHIISLGALFENNSMLWFTDDSRKDGRVWVGVRGPGFGLTAPLDACPTVFQPGVHAIERCVRDKLFRKLTGKRIYILLHSQAALKAPALLSQSWSVMECYVWRTWLLRMR